MKDSIVRYVVNRKKKTKKKFVLVVLCRHLNQAPKIREVDFSACSLTSQGAHIIADLIRVSKCISTYLKYMTAKTKTWKNSILKMKLNSMLNDSFVHSY